MFVLCIYEAVPEVYLAEALSLLPQLRFSDPCKLESVLELVKSWCFGIFDVLAFGKMHYVPNIVGLPLFESDELEVCMYSIIPHLDGWAEIAVRL